jgi:hypothetical protein
MAGTTLKRAQHFGGHESITKELVIQFNKFIDDIELVRAAVTATCVKLDAGDGVMDTDYAAQATVVLMDTAAEMLAAKIGNEAGTAIAA